MALGAAGGVSLKRVVAQKAAKAKAEAAGAQVYSPVNKHVGIGSAVGKSLVAPVQG